MAPDNIEISTKNQEKISVCYFSAIAAKANTIFNINSSDEDGIDATIRKELTTKDGEEYESELNFQLKSVYSRASFGYYDNGDIYYDLKVKNYNNLVTAAAVARYLVLLILPREMKDWVIESPDKITIRESIYYLSLKGNAPSSNEGTVRVRIPKENVFNHANLIKMLQKEADGDE